jgi:hypothetical protein
MREATTSGLPSLASSSSDSSAPVNRTTRLSAPAPPPSIRMNNGGSLSNRNPFSQGLTMVSNGGREINKPSITVAQTTSSLTKRSREEIIAEAKQKGSKGG